MRKIFIFIIILFFQLHEIKAQQKVRFSVFFNPGINWLQSDIKDVSYKSPTIGFDAGLTIDKFFTDKYAFSTGISITSLGGTLTYKNATDFYVHGENLMAPANSDVKYKLQYLTIPLGIKLKTNQIGYLTYFANLGFNLQFNIKSTASSNDQLNTLQNDNVSDEINFYNMGYFFGVGAEYSLGGSAALIFGITYSNGFLDITSSSSDKITSSTVAIRLGMMF
jgi:Outer membrane protein beta-barrel domain